MSKPQFAAEPSMEDILASIRKMISDEPTGPRPVPDQIARTVFSGNGPEVQKAVDRSGQKASEPSVSPQRATPNYSRLSDALATNATASALEGGSSAEDQIKQLLVDRAEPTLDSELISKPLAAFNGGQAPQSAVSTPERESAFDKSYSQSKEAALPFGRRFAETRPLSAERTASYEPSLGWAGSPDAAVSCHSGGVAAQREETSPIAKDDASETISNVPLNTPPYSPTRTQQSEPSKPVATPNKPSLVASLEKARADAASNVRGQKAEEPRLSEAHAPAPEAVAVALLEKSSARVSKLDAHSPAGNGAKVSPFETRSKVFQEGLVQADSSSRADTDWTGASSGVSKQSEKRGAETKIRDFDSDVPGDALASLQNSETMASVRAAAKSGSASSPSEALLDAVVDMVKNKPSSLSVFTSGSNFIHGVAGGEKPAIQSPQPRKLDTAASELLRPMLRQWLSENMPRIVEEALRSELDSSQKRGEDPDKA
jgi:cell pole-organizing protein PopZ